MQYEIVERTTADGKVMVEKVEQIGQKTVKGTLAKQMTKRDRLEERAVISELRDIEEPFTELK